MYPFSTENVKDLENLRNVYMDATLSPLLKASDFRQEGWRLENERVGDPKSPIIFKGVVYNEMKGALVRRHFIMVLSINCVSCYYFFNFSF
jgi:Zn-dependent M16 (insulinase) family peptidase